MAVPRAKRAPSASSSSQSGETQGSLFKFYEVDFETKADQSLRVKKKKIAQQPSETELPKQDLPNELKSASLSLLQDRALKKSDSAVAPQDKPPVLLSPGANPLIPIPLLAVGYANGRTLTSGVPVRPEAHVFGPRNPPVPIDTQPMSERVEVEIRRVQHSDYEVWRALCKRYFEKTGVADSVIDGTWKRLMKPSEYSLQCGVAIIKSTGQGVGLVHFSEHQTAWLGNSIQVFDLYVHESVRRTGVGLQLMDLVYDYGRKRGVSQVYWVTDAKNERVMALSDKSAQATNSVYFVRRL